ncbi:alpha/beta hydrolase [Mycobacterium sp. pR1184]|uniref:alpha/beta hydrolase n=1 Tax=Mycobacterium sp. pR1184 TaxID=3238981 RepID=UPI00351BE3E7
MVTQPIKRHFHHRRSPQSIAVSLASRVLVKNAVRAWALQPNLHWPLGHIDALVGLLPHRCGATVQTVRLDQCNAEWVRAPGVSPTRAILYLHGGAFLTCGVNTHRALVTRLSEAADAGVLIVGYRKLPSHQIADAIDDGLCGLRWLQQHGYDADRVVVAGDSAGGYLAFMTTLAAIRTQLATPAGVATVSPFTDANPERKLKHRNARRCSMFTAGALSIFSRYLGEVQLPDGPGSSAGHVVSPVDADLSALPPVAIHAGADELLLVDAELMAERLEANGIRCDLHVWDGQIHDFPLAADVLPEGRRAIRYLGDFVKEVTAGSWRRRSGHVTAAAG